MFERIKKLFTKKESRLKSHMSYPQLRQHFLDEFFDSGHHQWINDNRYIKATFEDFFDMLPQKVIRYFASDKSLLFLVSSGKYSCALTTFNAHIIVVFPELMQLLRSPANHYAMSILAHEMGHLLYEHGKQNIDPLQAQIEADRFACDLGFGHHLESFLEDQPESMEKRVRITYLTSRIISANAA